MSDIDTLTYIVKGMDVPEGVLTHVLETHTDKYNRDYHYDVCEFLAEAIEFSDKRGYYLLDLGNTITNDFIFKKLVSCESLSLLNLGLAGRFNEQRNAEIAKTYSHQLAMFCKKQSAIISEKEDDLVFGNAYRVYLNMPQNENKSIKEECDNSLDLLRCYVNQLKDTYDCLAKKHEFILDNFPCLRKILVRYFEKTKSAENLIDSAYEPFFDLSKSEDVVLDELNILNKHLNSTNNINHVKLKELIIKIQEQAECLELDSNNINKAIKKILITKLAGQLRKRLENLL